MECVLPTASNLPSLRIGLATFVFGKAVCWTHYLAMKARRARSPHTRERRASHEKSLNRNFSGFCDAKELPSHAWATTQQVATP